MTVAGEGNEEQRRSFLSQNSSVSSQQSSDSSQQSRDQNSKRFIRGFYLSIATNVFFLGIISCWVILQIVRSAPKDCPMSPTVPPPTSSSSVSEDSFFSCSPCKPMIKADDAETMRLTTGNSSYVCCKKINSDNNLEVSTIYKYVKCIDSVNNELNNSTIFWKQVATYGLRLKQYRFGNGNGN